MRHRQGVEVHLYSFFNLGARWGKWSMPCPGCFTPKKDLVLTVQEARWAPGPVYTGAENLAPTRIQYLDHPAHSELLYCLRYLGPPLPNFSQLKYLRPKAWNPAQNFYSCLIIKLFFTSIFFYSHTLSVGFFNSACFIHFNLYLRVTFP